MMSMANVTQRSAAIRRSKAKCRASAVGNLADPDASYTRTRVKDTADRETYREDDSRGGSSTPPIVEVAQDTVQRPSQSRCAG